ncbi:hypothetical protein KGQ19_00655 [Catenulispora sp. NL8]|uniref:Putative Flp pilus-assembly TadG-like N-terminal domain-containing protein n=1 Tax=Catenulispora pinistramenti TaxID=2705254 RepID=A0ABS5KGP4_9ACTN|nr:pilus assembly protein TadG-related protein [Catenulispora pinistramenti]MBS2545369.1 hypothetical protein [Catenulispora pinistramenti]
MRVLLRRLAGDDRGSISMMVAVMFFGWSVMIGLVVDGGGKLAAIEHADAVANEAARAGGQAIDPTKAIPGTAIVVDPTAAVSAAQTFLANAGVNGTVVPAADGKSIDVTVDTSYQPLFTGAFGVGSWSVTGHGSAQLLTAVVAP